MTRTWIRGLQERSYNSGNQAITSGGQIVLPHGLGIDPSRIECWIKCVTANLGYAVGDKLLIAGGISVVTDVTNITVRFGSGGAAFSIFNKATGASGNITNTSWKFIIQAWA